MKIIYSLILSLLTFTQINAQEFNGFWESQGVGIFVDITDNQIDLYSYNSISMVQFGYAPIDSNVVGMSNNLIGELSLIDDLLYLSFSSTLAEAPIIFEPREELPEITASTDDPVTNFDIFWTTFEEYCSLFAILDVDWQAQYDLYRPQIDENTSDSLLFVFMGNMIKELDDGHCYLIDEENQVGVGSGTISNSSWVNYVDKYIELFEDKYLDPGSIISYTQNNKVVAATIDGGNIGYLFINSFEIGEENTLNDNILFDNILDEVFEYLENTESLIIDIRNNGGGYDSNARVLGNRLTKTTKPVFSIINRLKESYTSFTEPFSLEITPSDNIQYVDKPIMVLTSNASASAAESFALLAKEIECVTTVGGITEGIFSNIFTRSLPNDWIYTLSTQFYLDVNGVNHEQIGVIPDILVEEDLEALLEDDKDVVLEYAINNITSSCETTSILNNKTDPTLIAYPNPFTHSITIDASVKLDPSSTVSILDISGNKLYKQKLNYESTLDLSRLPDGMYNLVIENEANTIKKRIIKITN